MHEMGVAQQMIDILMSSIPDDMDDPKIETVNLRIGKLAAVVEDSLRFCFEILAKGTALEEARLVIESVPVKARCKACGNEWEVDGPVFSCPECEDGAVEVLSGRELEIQSFEVAD